MLGAKGMLLVLLIMALAGGVLAVIAAARKQKTFAYGPAIGIGVLTHFLLEIRGVL